MSKCHFANSLLYCFIGLILSLSAVNAQTYKAHMPEHGSPTIPLEFKQDKIKVKILHRLSHESNYVGKEGFAENVAAYPASMFLTGLAYPGWEAYRSLLESSANAFAKSIGDTTEYHVLITREPDVNASATEAGYIFFNVGMLAEAETYEELLIVLGHEMGHNMENHMWEGAVDMSKAKTSVFIASIFGTKAYYLSKFIAINAVMKHSRDDEQAADDIAITFLKNANISIAEAAKLYQRFAQLEKNHQIKFGENGKHWIYGSSHPATKDRFEKMTAIVQENTVHSVPDGFYELRNEARYETLSLLLAQSRYRDAIERGWGYLMQNPDDMIIKEFIFDAVSRFNQIYEAEVLDMPVLTAGYFMSNAAANAMNNNDLSNAEALSSVQALLSHDGDMSKSPFACNITFNQLFELLKKEIRASGSTESLLLLALSESPVNKLKLQQYIDRGGYRKEYATNLLKRTETKFTNAILIPYELYLPGSEFSGEIDYAKFMKIYDWQPILSEISSSGFTAKMQRMDQVAEMTPYEWEMNRRILSFMDNFADKEPDPIDIILLDPDLGNYLMERGIGRCFSFSIFYDGQTAQGELSIVKVDGEPMVQNSDGIALGVAVARNYAYNQFMKRYKKLSLE